MSAPPTQNSTMFILAIVCPRHYPRFSHFPASVVWDKLQLRFPVSIPFSLFFLVFTKFVPDIILAFLIFPLALSGTNLSSAPLPKQTTFLQRFHIPYINIYYHYICQEPPRKIHWHSREFYCTRYNAKGSGISIPDPLTIHTFIY